MTTIEFTITSPESIEQWDYRAGSYIRVKDATPDKKPATWTYDGVTLKINGETIEEYELDRAPNGNVYWDNVLIIRTATNEYDFDVTDGFSRLYPVHDKTIKPVPESVMAGVIRVRRIVKR